MAELVNLHLEATLPELEEMERIGLFNRKEIKLIIKKTKAFEYKLRRMTKSKDNYLKYIEYEINLLDLIAKRRQRLVCDDKKEEIDNSIAKRINKLFRNAVSHYSEDEKLKLDQIQFCRKMKWYNTMHKLYTELLKCHPNNPSLWVMVAKWEMEESRLPENARQLFQRGLVLNPASQYLWREYFRMEMMYIDWVRKRKAVLESRKVEDIEMDEEDVILNGAVAHVVYNSAVEACPEVEYALSFIQICLEFDFGSKHINYILQEVQEKFPDQEETLDALAKQPLLNLQEEIKAGKEKGIKKRVILDRINEEIHAKYEEAVKTIPTEKMWSFYLEFISNLLQSAKDNKKSVLQDIIVSLMERAHEDNSLALSFYSEWVDLFLERDQEREALSLSLFTAKKWNTVDLWHKCLTLHIQCLQPHEVVYEHLMEAIDSVNVKDSVILWKLGVKWLTLCNREKVKIFFEIGIKKPKEVSFPLKDMYLDHIILTSGITKARDLYMKFKKLGPLSPLIVKKMIKVEMSQLDPSIDILRKYFEDGLKEFGSTNVDIWIEYLKLEQQHTDGQISNYNTLCWRAKKTLNAEFLQEFHLRSMLLDQSP